MVSYIIGPAQTCLKNAYRLNTPNGVFLYLETVYENLNFTRLNLTQVLSLPQSRMPKVLIGEILNRNIFCINERRISGSKVGIMIDSNLSDVNSISVTVDEWRARLLPDP